MSITIVWTSAAALLVASMAHCAAAPSPGPARFSVTETSGQPGERLTTVSFPYAAGEITDLEAAYLTDEFGNRVRAQCRVLNRHRDGSIRRALIRFPWSPEPNATATFTVLPAAADALPGGLVTAASASSIAIEAGLLSVRSNGASVLLRSDGNPDRQVSPVAPGFPDRFLGPEVAVIEDGPYFAWVSLAWFGGQWNVYMEVQATRTGEVAIAVRLRMMQGGSADMPRFGLRISGLNPQLYASGPHDLPFTTTTADGGPTRFTFGATGQDNTLVLPDGPQIRQGRVSIDYEGAGASFELLRDASLDDTVAGEHKQFYEGQERSVQSAILPPGGRDLGSRAEVPAERRCVAVVGREPVDWGGLRGLRAVNTEHALKLVCRDGDQFGDVASGANPSAPQWSLSGLTRIDTGLDMLEDYYRGGDHRLRDLAIGWAENWVTLKQYRGWDMNSYGGERYTMVAWNYIPSYCQKGIMMIAHAYEETGDPRYLESALSFADRVVKQTQTRYFLSGSGVDPYTIGGDANIRPGYLGRDLVLMYRWTGDERYLNAARQIVHGLAALCTGDHGLLREGYSDPFSPFERLVTGTDLGVTEDNSDHLKPFILNYLLEGAQFIYEETGDPTAGETMVSISDFMLSAMQDGGIWNYAQRHAAEGNSIGHMTVEIANTLLNSYMLNGDERYRTAAFDALHLVCKSYEAYGVMVNGVTPPKDRAYFYPDDRCDLDFYRGTVSLNSIGRDAIGYFFSAVDRMLRIDPDAGEFLLSAPTHPRHKWIVAQVPIGGRQVSHEIGHCYIAQVDMGRDGDRESGGKSELVLLEDGRLLGPRHCLHADIRSEGTGRYSHWTRSSIYFSASDNSDPRTNGRTYAYYYGSPERIPDDGNMTELDTGGPYAQRRPHASVALYEEGIEAERTGRQLDAIAAWERILAQWTDASPELFRQIALWDQTGDAEGALRTCRRFVETFPEDDRTPSVRLDIARRLIGSGETQEAQEMLEEAAKRYEGTPWGEEAAVRLWHEFRVGVAPANIVKATRTADPEPAPVTSLQAADGLPAPPALSIGAGYDDENLYIALAMSTGGPWPSREAREAVRLIVDARADLTEYQLFIVDSDGKLEEREPMWHNRGQGLKPAAGWSAEVTRGEEGWVANLVIPFAEIGFSPEPGHRTWRLGYRWDSIGGVRLWRPAIPNAIRPHDCGWIVFD